MLNSSNTGAKYIYGNRKLSLYKHFSKLRADQIKEQSFFSGAANSTIGREGGGYVVPLGLALPLQGRRGVERRGGHQLLRRRCRGEAMRAVAREKSGLDVVHRCRRPSTGSAAAEGSFDVLPR